MFNLDNKIAVVTGASSGIGHDAAIAYAKAGANVAVLARRKEKLDELVEEIKALNKKAIAVKCDVTNEENVKEAINTVIEEFGTIDILADKSDITSRHAYNASKAGVIG
ncbi:MAG: SDR family NAD(P)-dependent oxidoreductase [Clostridium sp.]|nr:SDR family NAD(P)-dependent oxidoreductase [Clostridium sp.]